MLKASLERGLEAELGEHVGYERGDPDAARFDNSRNGSFAKTVATEIGDVELAVPVIATEHSARCWFRPACADSMASTR